MDKLCGGKNPLIKCDCVIVLNSSSTQVSLLCTIEKDQVDGKDYMCRCCR